MKRTTNVILALTVFTLVLFCFCMPKTAKAGLDALIEINSPLTLIKPLSTSNEETPLVIDNLTIDYNVDNFADNFSNTVSQTYLIRNASNTTNVTQCALAVDEKMLELDPSSFSFSIDGNSINAELRYNDYSADSTSEPWQYVFTINAPPQSTQTLIIEQPAFSRFNINEKTPARSHINFKYNFDNLYKWGNSANPSADSVTINLKTKFTFFQGIYSNLSVEKTANGYTTTVSSSQNDNTLYFYDINPTFTQLASSAIFSLKYFIVHFAILFAVLIIEIIFLARKKPNRTVSKVPNCVVVSVLILVALLQILTFIFAIIVDNNVIVPINAIKIFVMGLINFPIFITCVILCVINFRKIKQHNLKIIDNVNENK